MPTCSEIEHTETRVMEGISGEFIWNEQSGMPPEKNIVESPCGGQAPAGVVPLGAWSPMTL